MKMGTFGLTFSINNLYLYQEYIQAVRHCSSIVWPCEKRKGLFFVAFNSLDNIATR